jgi:PHD/YefM family antitoxin component YafN of YafNO toxin-antitoxin module
MVERKGKPFAVVISPDQYAMLEKELERAWQTVGRVRERNAGKDPDEVFQDVTATVEAVRQELYEESRRPRPRRR